MLNQASDAKTYIITGPAISEKKRDQIERLGARVIQTPLKKEGIDIELLMDRLGEMTVTQPSD